MHVIWSALPKSAVTSNNDVYMILDMSLSSIRTRAGLSVLVTISLTSAIPEMECNSRYHGHPPMRELGMTGCFVFAFAMKEQIYHLRR